MSDYVRIIKTRRKKFNRQEVCRSSEVLCKESRKYVGLFPPFIWWTRLLKARAKILGISFHRKRHGTKGSEPGAVTETQMANPQLQFHRITLVILVTPSLIAQLPLLFECENLCCFGLDWYVFGDGGCIVLVTRNPTVG